MLSHLPLFLCGVDELFHRRGKIDIADTIDKEERIEMDGVAQTAFLRIASSDGFVVDRTPEVTVIAQDVLGHSGVKGWVYLTHQYRGRAKRFGHPLGKTRVFT